MRCSLGCSRPGRRGSSAPRRPRSCCAPSAPARPGPRTLRRLAAELIAEVRHLDRRITAAAGDITAAVAASNTALTELCGIGDLTAGRSWPGLGHNLAEDAAALVALRAC